MNNDLELGINFVFNTPEAEAEAKRIETSISSIGKSADGAAKKLSDSVSKMAAANQEILDKYSKQAREAEQIFKNKQSAPSIAPAVPESNNIQKVADEIIKLKNANEQNNQSQEKSTSILDVLGIETFTWTDLVSLATTAIIDNREKIYDWAVGLITGQEANDKLRQSQEDLNTALESSQYSNAIKSIYELKAGIEEAEKGHRSSKSVIDQYNETLGESAGKETTLKGVKDSVVRNSDNYVEAILKEAYAQTVLTNAIKSRVELEERKRNGSNFSDKSNAITTTLSAVLNNPSEIGDIGDIYTQAKNRNKQYGIQALAESEKEGFEDYKKAYDGLQVFLKKTNLTLDKADKPDKVKKDQSISERKSLLSKLADIDAEYSRKSFSKDAEEIAALKDQFTKISKLVLDFNKNNPKAAISLISLNNLEKNAISDLKYRQSTDKQAVEFDKQKKLFEDYENFKTAYGKEAADKRFGTEVKSSADLLKQKQADYLKLALKATVGGGLTGGEQERLAQDKEQIAGLQTIEAKRYQDAYNSALTFNQKVERINEEYRANAIALGADITEEQKKNLSDQRDNAVNTAKDEALKKTAIYKKLAQETLELTQSDAKKQSEALKTLLADGSINGEVKSQIEQQLSKLEVTLSIGVNQSNLNDLKAKLALTKDLLNPEKNGGIIVSPDETKRIVKDITAIQKKINDATNPKGGAKSNFVKGLEENFKYLKGDAATVATGVSKDLGAVSGTFGQLSEAVGGVNTETGYTLDTIAKLAAVGSDAAGSFAAFASGDIIGGVTKAVSAVTGLFSIGKKVKEMNAAARKEVDDFYINAIAGEREYQDLVKERQLQTIRNNKTALQGIRDELALRKSQGAEYAKESEEIMAKLQGKSFIQSESYTHGTWFRKANVEKSYSSLQGMNFEQLSALLSQGKLDGEAKALVERLKELEQKGFDAQQAIADLAKETQVIFTGTTGDSLTDSILDMFKSGKTGAQDLADFFKKTMDGAALSIFKNKVLSDLMNKFYDEFAKKAESNDELTKDETEELQTLFTSLTDEAKTKYEQFKKVAGSDLGSLGEDTGLTGQITNSITEETGSELAGLQRSMYDITKQGVVVAKDSLAAIKQQTLYQYQIEINTRETATQVKNAVSELQTINSNMKGSGSTAYDRGFL
ncbi:hypothetical protein [Pedobacter sp. D749]|uniref:hypothetical protein n=1 Tax=Pedobacter sp. D749 TaxID=2856523 RepID=UPI001C5A2317|nr:hypothetical protein [Pedobacter sp. D749]QXU42090.1 hypothetical protein KYH19_00355 [Pedobacter sp. D749]